MQKYNEDRWDVDPPSVTSYLQCRHENHTALVSPVCGFGWRFRITDKCNPGRKDLTGSRKRVVAFGEMGVSAQTQLLLEFDPHLCTRMKLSSFSIKWTWTNSDSPLGSRTGVQMDCVTAITEITFPPLQSVHIQITIIFSPDDKLSFPVPPPSPPPSPPLIAPRGREVLRTSLEGLSFFDTKVYLNSAKHTGSGLACRPRAIFSNVEHLRASCTYLKDLLSEDVFRNGITCDLFDENSEVTQKLSDSDYGYECDSDLDTVFDEEEVVALGVDEGNEDAEHPPVSREQEIESQSTTSLEPFRVRRNDCLAYAINGTAFRTFRAFVMYTYTGNLDFSGLRSTRKDNPPTDKCSPGTENTSETQSVRCSPKSMYRFADYADMPRLKKYAKHGIKLGLTEQNIITELFCPFTSKYAELIEMECDFLLKHFNAGVERAFDEMHQAAMSGTKPCSFRVLAFAIKRLRGLDAVTAWRRVDSVT